MNKKITIVIGIAFLAIIGLNACAETISDSTNDVAHWSTSAGNWGWTSFEVGSKPNIDIKQLTQTVNGDKMECKLIVEGEIIDDSLHFYWATFNTSDSIYWFQYTGGSGSGMASSSESFNFDMEVDVTAQGNTITAIFDIVGEDNNAEEFWGYAYQYSNAGNLYSAEYWGDWVPDSKFNYDDDDILTDNQDSNNNDNSGEDSQTNDDTSNNNQNTPPPSGTSGFEMLTLILATIAIIAYIRKRK